MPSLNHCCFLDNSNYPSVASRKTRVKDWLCKIELIAEHFQPFLHQETND